MLINFIRPDMPLAASPLGFIRPEIPTLVPEPPSGEGWIHEIKHDGYRTLFVIDGDKVRAFSRHGRDLTGLYRRVVDAAGKLSCQDAIIYGEIIVQDENGISDFDALRSAIHRGAAPHRVLCLDLLHLDGQDQRRTPLIERRAALRKLIEPDPRSPIHFSDHVDCDGAKFFKAAAELGLEGIVSKRVQSLCRGGPSRSWLKTKKMVEGEFILLGTERDSDGVPWALLASVRGGRLEFAGPAILNPPRQDRRQWGELIAALAVTKPPLRGLRQGSAQWLRPELRVRVKHLKAKGMLRHTTVKQLITD
jgi:bifunctional non-homologous end joining protein LigD